EPVHWNALCAEIGLQPPPGVHGLGQLETRSYRAAESWLTKKHPPGQWWDWESFAPEIVGRSWESPWQAVDCPPLAELIAQYETQFDQLHQASRKSVFYSPSATALTNQPTADFGGEFIIHLRTMVRALAGRANLRIGEGDLEG